MQSTGKRLGLMLWECNIRNPGDLQDIISENSESVWDKKGVGTALNIYKNKRLPVNGCILESLNKTKMKNISQEIVEYNLKCIKNEISLKLPGAEKKLKKRKLSDRTECKSESDCLSSRIIKSHLEMSVPVTENDNPGENRSRAPSDVSNDGNRNDRRSDRKPFQPALNWKREFDHEVPADAGFTDPIVVSWSDKCPTPEAEYTLFHLKDGTNVKNEILTLELSSRTKLKGLVMALEKVIFKFVTNTGNINSMQTLYILGPDNTNYILQFQLTPETCIFNEPEDALDDDTRLTRVSFPDIKSMLTFAFSNLERVKCDTAIGFFLFTPIMVDSISFPNNHRMTICLPSLAKFMELYEYVRETYPYGAPQSGDLMHAKEQLENHYFQNFNSPEYKSLCDWYPFTVEDLPNSVQTVTSRFNTSMAMFKCEPHQANVLEANTAINARGEDGQVINKKGIGSIFNSEVISKFGNFSNQYGPIPGGKQLTMQFNQIGPKQWSGLVSVFRVMQALVSYIYQLTLHGLKLDSSGLFQGFMAQLYCISRLLVTCYIIITELLIRKLPFLVCTGNITLKTFLRLICLGSFMANSPSRITGILDTPSFPFYQRLSEYKPYWYNLDPEDSLIRQRICRYNSVAGTQYLSGAQSRVHTRFLRIPKESPKLPPMGQKESATDDFDPEDPKAMAEQIKFLKQSLHEMKAEKLDVTAHREQVMIHDRKLKTLTDGADKMNDRQLKLQVQVATNHVTGQKALCAAKQAKLMAQVNGALTLGQSRDHANINGYLQSMAIPQAPYISGHLQTIQDLDDQICDIEARPDRYMSSMEHTDLIQIPAKKDAFIPVHHVVFKKPEPHTLVTKKSHIFAPGSSRLNAKFCKPLTSNFTPAKPISLSAIDGSGPSVPAPPLEIESSMSIDFDKNFRASTDVSDTSEASSIDEPPAKRGDVKSLRSKTLPKRKKPEPKRDIPDDFIIKEVNFSVTPLDSCRDAFPVKNMNANFTINASQPCFPVLTNDQLKVFPISEFSNMEKPAVWPTFPANKHLAGVEWLKMDETNPNYLLYRYLCLFHPDLILLQLTHISNMPNFTTGDFGETRLKENKRLVGEAKYFLDEVLNPLAGALANDLLLIQMAESETDSFITLYPLPAISLALFTHVSNNISEYGVWTPGEAYPFFIKSVLRILLSKRYPNLKVKYQQFKQADAKNLVNAGKPNKGSSSIRRSSRRRGGTGSTNELPSNDDEMHGQQPALETENPTNKPVTGDDYFSLNGQILPDKMIKEMLVPPYPKPAPRKLADLRRKEVEERIFDKLPVKTMTKINNCISKTKNKRLRIKRLQKIDHRIPLRIVSTNLNNPAKQLNTLIINTNNPDIILINELFLPENQIQKRTFLNFDQYYFLYNATKYRNSKYIFSLIMYKKSLCMSATKIKTPAPFISVNFALRLENDQVITFNLTTFYMPHLNSKAQKMLNIKPARHFHFFVQVFKKLFTIQANLPSILTGDLNCDYKTPRDEDNKVFANFFQRSVNKYTEHARMPTNVPNKRVAGQKPKNSRIDTCLSKGLELKFKQTPGRITAKNDGHVVFHIDLDLEPVFLNSKVRFSTFSKPTPEAIFDESIVQYELVKNRLELEQQECEQLIRQRETEGTFEPITQPVKYISSIINLLDKVTNSVTKPEEIFVNKFNSVNKLEPETKAVTLELQKLTEISFRRELTGSERLEFARLKEAQEYMFSRDRQDYMTGFIEKSEGRYLNLKEQFSVNRKFNNKSKGRTFPDSFTLEKMTDIYQEQQNLCKPVLGREYAPSRFFVKEKLSTGHFQIDWAGNNKKFALEAAARSIQPFTLGYDSRLNGHTLACYHKDYRKLFFHLTKFCLALGYFPPEWKKTKIVPIPKKAPETGDTGNGQTVSARFLGVSPAPAQITSKTVSPNVTQLLDSGKIFPDNQHAFRPSFSTGTCLGEIFNNINKIPANQTVILISFDIKKAFDSIPHEALGQKLDLICEPNIAQYLKDELRNREYYVVHRGKSGPKMTGNGAGVLQGGCNSPAELSLMLADINYVFQFETGNKRSLYADDVSMVVVSKRVRDENEDTLRAKVSNVMSKMVTYLDGLGLELNWSKTGIIKLGKYEPWNVGTPEVPIMLKESENILGLRFTCELFNNDSFEPEIKHRIRRLGEFRYCLINIEYMGYIKFRRLLAFLFVYGILNYVFEIIPIQTKDVYNRINAALGRIIQDLWDFDVYTGKRYSYARLFYEASWMNARNTHYYNILNFADRTLRTRKPPSLYREMLLILKYNDGTPFIPHGSRLKCETEISNEKFMLGYYPVVSYKHKVRSKMVFPYCLSTVFEDVPNRILQHLGRPTFKKLIHYELKFRCQHADKKTCSFCNFMSPRPQHLMSVNWNVHTLTGFGSFENTNTEFTETRRIVQSNIDMNDIASHTASQLNVSDTASIPHHIVQYNEYYKKLHKKAHESDFVEIPVSERFQFNN